MSQDEHECPICYEALDIVSYTNVISTECGHRFHTNCLLKHISFNGYGCPCCRTKMIENDAPYTIETEQNPFDNRIEDSDDETIAPPNANDSTIEFEENTNNVYLNRNSHRRSASPIELEDEDYRLDGMRWLFQQANEEPTDVITPYSEEYEQWLRQYHQNQEEQNHRLDERVKKYMDILSQIKSVDYKDFVWGFLYCMDDRFSSSVTAYQANQKIFSTLIALRNRMDPPSTIHRPST